MYLCPINVHLFVAYKMYLGIYNNWVTNYLMIYIQIYIDTYIYK